MSMASDLYEEIARYLEERDMKPANFSLETSLEDLGVDSLDLLALSQDIEKKYRISLDDERIAAVRKLSDLIGFIEQAHEEQVEQSR